MAKKKKKTKAKKKKPQDRKKKQPKKDKEKSKKKFKMGCSIIAGLSVLAFGAYTLLKRPGNSSYDENKIQTIAEDPKYLKLSKLEKAALLAAERISGNLVEDKDFKFYENSKNIVLYFPDHHNKYYQEKQKKRLILLDKELKNLKIKISGFGLEGFIQGVHSKEKLVEISEDEKIFKEKIFAKYRNEKKEVWNKFNKKFENAIINELRDFNSTKVIKETYVFFQSIFDILFAVRASLNIGDEWEKNDLYYYNAPGKEYVGLIDTMYFGLENKSIINSTVDMQFLSLEIACELFNAKTKMNNFYKKNASFLAENLYFLFQDLYQKTLAEINQAFDNFGKKLPSAWLEKINKLIKESPQEAIAIAEKTDAENKEEALLKTDYWINAIPEDMKDIVIIIGGSAHKDWYKELADKAKLSYIILPELK